MQTPDRLPPRDLPRRRSGRHRNPLSFDSSVGTPALVLAVPGHARADRLGAQMADLVRAYRPEVTLRLGHTHGTEETLTEALAGLEPSKEQAVRAVVVPLTTAPHQPTLDAISAAGEAAGAGINVTEGLGPHPMLAEVLHLRLAEGGFVRADRMRFINVVSTSADMADGVIVGAAGGADSVNAAGVTAVLLAARLGVTVLPADMSDPTGIRHVLDQLREGGAQRPVIAPCAFGAEFEAEAVAELAGALGVRYSAPLGADSVLAKIVALRYAEVLNSLGLDAPATVEELPAPVGSRHRPEG